MSVIWSACMASGSLVNMSADSAQANIFWAAFVTGLAPLLYCLMGGVYSLRWTHMFQVKEFVF